MALSLGTLTSLKNYFESIGTGPMRKTTSHAEYIITAMHYGNHKSTEENMEQTIKLMDKDVALDFSLVFPKDTTELIPNAEVYPNGL